MGPVGWALIAFDVISLSLDLWDQRIIKVINQVIIGRKFS